MSTTKQQTFAFKFAAVSIPEIALGTTSDENGRYILEKHTGKIRMQIQYLGKVSIDTLINVNKDWFLILQ